MQSGFLCSAFWRDHGHVSTVIWNLHIVHQVSAHAMCDITLQVRFISTF